MVTKNQLYFVQGEGWKGYSEVVRTVNYKTNPSMHECDARCMFANGRTMNCECACGGKITVKDHGSLVIKINIKYSTKHQPPGQKPGGFIFDHSDAACAEFR